MTTDMIREKFESWFDNNTMGWTEEDKVLSRVTWEDAYAQGQRDLIEAMGEPVAWRVISKAHGINQVVSNTRVVKSWNGVSDSSTPLYALPEDTPK